MSDEMPLFAHANDFIKIYGNRIPAKFVCLMLVAFSLLHELAAEVCSQNVKACVVEELIFQVTPARISDFIRHDAEVWTTALAKQPGYLGKDVWTSKSKADEVRLIIRWRTEQDWHNTPKQLLEQADKEFKAAMGGSQDYKMISSKALYQHLAPPPVSTKGLLVRLAEAGKDWPQIGKEIAIAHDHVYKKRKRYQAVPFAKVLQDSFNLDEIDTSKARLVFECRDGYQSNMLLSKALASDGWLALKDLDATTDDGWVKVRGVSPAPYYVVWRGVEPDAAKYPWAYALEKLRLVDEDVFFKAAYPSHAKQALPGYHAFRQHCLRCHAINGVGGQLGVELNSPRSVTEYWKAEELRAFITSPGSFRLRSKMPSMKHVPSGELDAILLYLREMASVTSIAE